jgi:ABC-type nitrate/sulfonate/bicarbonate transport system ATPase subunit
MDRMREPIRPEEACRALQGGRAQAGAMASASKLVVRNVTKTFPSPEGGGTFVALDNVSLEFSGDEFVCLVGPSGCGKTTLLNLIAGFVEQSSGQLLVDGKAISGASSDRGVVFQDYALFPWLTVRKNVQFGPRVRNISPEEREVLADKYLKMVGLSEFAGRYPYQLSGGMKQRVAIARALINHPSMLLMDEPFGALDAMTRETMQDEFIRLARLEPKLIIFVTHSVLEAVFLADRVVVMAAKPGRIIVDMRIPLAHPRERTATEVTMYVRQIRDLLEQGHAFSGEE